MAEGTNSEWNCQIKAWPSTNFSLVLNKTAVLLPKPGDEECGKEPLVIFSVQEDPQHVCFSSYHVSVAICSANESVVGVFQILSSSGRGTTVVVKLTQEPSVASSGSLQVCPACSPLNFVLCSHRKQQQQPQQHRILLRRTPQCPVWEPGGVGSHSVATVEEQEEEKGPASHHTDAQPHLEGGVLV